MKYYSIEEIDNIEKPQIYGYKTLIIKDFINNIAFFDFELKNEMKQIEELKKNLSDTDYQAIKYAEGQITAEDYEPIKAQRQAWRDEINRLEAELNESEN